MKKLFAVLSSLIVIALSAFTVSPATAVGSNLVPNPSVEQNVSNKPTSWSSDKWGTNTTTFTYANTGSHTGTYSVTTKMTAHSSGDAKWYFAPVAVTGNTNYTFSDWYKSTVKSTIDVEVTSTDGKLSYIWLGDLANSSNNWKQATYTFTAPATASKVTVYHSIKAVGSLTTDDYNLATTGGTTTPPPAPTPPTVALTAPAPNATVSGTAALSANASDASAVASVQFKVDGNNAGSADTTAPFSVDWNSSSVANGSHSVTAVATNASGLSTTSSPVTVTVNNTVTPTTPTVSVSAPAAGSTVSGSTTVSANASDTTPLAGVQFKLDGNNVGAEDTTSPYSIAWDTTGVTDGTHSLTAVARNTADGSATSAPVSVTVKNTVAPTPPTVSVSAPAANATVTGSATLTASASDAKGITSVQFKVDGVNVGTADTTSPYSITWDSKTVSDGTHSVTAVATNSSNLTTTSSPVSITVSNPVAPTVSVTAPAGGATVSGTTALTASASDSKSTITSVQFKVDGNNVGTADTTSPYSFDWDSKSVANGSHTITAVATNSANLSTTSASVTVTVNNTTVTPPPVTTPTNLIANPSMETANGAAPANWISSNWGTNTSTFSYLNTGHTGSHSVKVQTTAYTNGAANWFYNEVPVTAGKTYLYTNWYQSNVDTEVDAEVTMSDGSVQYFWLGTVLANTNWTQFKSTFAVPAGAKSMAIYQILGKVGYITSDDYSLSEYTPAPYNRAIVSVTFDDGWANQYQNAYPVITQLGIQSTFYIISGELTDQPDYMSGVQVKNLFASGNEIASHSVTHPDLTTVTATKLQNEMANSQTTLQNLIGAPVTDFAYPFGAYNGNTIAVGNQYYASQRSVNGGLNTRDNLDVTQLKIHEIDSNISQAQVKAWIDEAIATNSWLILCYHEIATSPSAPDDALYTTQPGDFTSEMNYLKSTGVSTQTVKQALSEVLAQQ
jgi:peptidoglycan/xylan/chitin deacetylase (PgdA/CDA1 family)